MSQPEARACEGPGKGPRAGVPSSSSIPQGVTQSLSGAGRPHTMPATARAPGQVHVPQGHVWPDSLRLSQESIQGTLAAHPAQL